MPERLDLAALSKVELHRHLEGCIRATTAYELGQAGGHVAPGESFEAFRAKVVVERPRALLEVLACFDHVRRSIVGLEAVARIAREAVEDAAADQLELCELRFSPLTLGRAAGLSMDETKLAVRRGVDEALAAGLPLRVPLVAVISRRHGVEMAWEVLRHIERDAGDTYVGADFASDELRHRTAAFGEVAAALAGLGLPLTVHTGEGVGPDHVADVLALPGVRRLGHAVSLSEDPALVAAVRDRELVVEICPTSNLLTGIVPSYAQHPARKLLAAGVRVALCTDNPSMFAVDLSHELAVARDSMGFSDADLKRCQAWAREAAFG